MEHATCRDLFDAVEACSAPRSDDLDRRGVDDFLWIDAGIVGQTHRRVDALLRARGLDMEERAEDLLVESVRWIDGLDPEERLEVALQVMMRWRWLWRADATVSEHDSTYLTTLGAWISDDLELLLAVAFDRLDRTPLPAARLARLVMATAASLFDRSSLLPRWRVVDAVARTLRGGPPEPALRESLDALLDAESRPGARARRGSPNQAGRIADLLAAG